MRNLLSKFFKRKPPPPKTIDDHLSDIEERLVKDLALAKEQESGNPWSNEDINTCILSLEKIDELREKRASRKNKSFLNSPAGASILTAIIAITATQIPAMTQTMTQMIMAREAEETKRLKPIFEIVAKDSSLSLDEKINVLDFLSSSDYRYETVSKYLESYRAEMKRRKEYKRRTYGPQEGTMSADDDPNKANSAAAKSRAAD